MTWWMWMVLRRRGGQAARMWVEEEGGGGGGGGGGGVAAADLAAPVSAYLHVCVYLILFQPQQIYNQFSTNGPSSVGDNNSALAQTN